MRDIIKLHNRVYTFRFGKCEESLVVYINYKNVSCNLVEGYVEFIGTDPTFTLFTSNYTKEQNRLNYVYPLDLLFSSNFCTYAISFYELKILIQKYHAYHEDLYTAIKDISAMTQIPKIINAYDVFIKIE